MRFENIVDTNQEEQNQNRPLKDLLSEIAAQLGLAFLYRRRYEANISLDNIQLPCMVFLEPDEFNFTIQPTSGNIFDADNVFVQFLDQREMSQDAEAREYTMRTMRDKARQFVNIIANSSDLSIGAVARGVPVIDAYDANCVGVEISANIGLEYPSQECI
jgi:hypothetical protein